MKKGKPLPDFDTEGPTKSSKICSLKEYRPDSIFPTNEDLTPQSLPLPEIGRLRLPRTHSRVDHLKVVPVPLYEVLPRPLIGIPIGWSGGFMVYGVRKHRDQIAGANQVQAVIGRIEIPAANGLLVEGDLLEYLPGNDHEAAVQRLHLDGFMEFFADRTKGGIAL